MSPDDDADGRLRRLTSGLSHELRNPVTAALLQLEVFQRRVEATLPAATLEPVRLAQAELQRVMALLQQLLAFTRPAPVEPQRLDALALVRHLVAVEAPRAASRGVSLVVDAAVDASVFGDLDEAQVTQVLQNVLRNAIEASDHGDEVTLRVTADAGALTIAIADQGEGIPPAIRPRLFEPFVTTKRTGTGMGLAIARSIVGQHGGTIDVTDNATGGVTFALRFPAAP
jgi:two-component system, NtrC family, sensor histidine kinase HydH